MSARTNARSGPVCKERILPAQSRISGPPRKQRRSLLRVSAGHAPARPFGGSKSIPRFAQVNQKFAVLRREVQQRLPQRFHQTVGSNGPKWREEAPEVGLLAERAAEAGVPSENQLDNEEGDRRALPVRTGLHHQHELHLGYHFERQSNSAELLQLPSE